MSFLCATGMRSVFVRGGTTLSVFCRGDCRECSSSMREHMRFLASSSATFTFFLGKPGTLFLWVGLEKGGSSCLNVLGLRFLLDSLELCLHILNLSVYGAVLCDFKGVSQLGRFS